MADLRNNLSDPFRQTFLTDSQLFQVLFDIRVITLILIILHQTVLKTLNYLYLCGIVCCKRLKHTSAL